MYMYFKETFRIKHLKYGKCWEDDTTNVRLTSKCTDVWRYGGQRHPEGPYSIWHETTRRRVTQTDAGGFNYNIITGKTPFYTLPLHKDNMVQPHRTSFVHCISADEETGFIGTFNDRLTALRTADVDACITDETKIKLLPGMLKGLFFYKIYTQIIESNFFL